MKVFISWSGSVSLKLANVLYEWLPTVIQSVKPFLSDENVQKGGRWLDAVGRELESTDFGIVVLTPSALQSPWLHFEAGALSKRLEHSRVAPLLVGLTKENISPPLSMFQMVLPREDEVRKLLGSMNEQIKDGALAENVLKQGL